MEGVIGVKTEIKKVKWEINKIHIYLADGRELLIPTKLLPSVKKTKTVKRNKAYIIDNNMFTWDTCPEVYHIEQVLGKEKDYQYRG